jgi:hypothetical protein
MFALCRIVSAVLIEHKSLVFGSRSSNKSFNPTAGVGLVISKQLGPASG